ncbi:hypothetical protein [Sediminibacterium sp.]|uniref:hypothetical protein n=1 Tax=Sediminibacterium sp. TaxID=1917865 RepID=UPI002734AF6C|nr:hypothetical protein [Sediminibacterium sp.]MDP3394708.1 hypothetical protein [Sediminibacterium sp.]MDP3568543.1 hypothetical protein [Sediminibacterium sp.]
MEGNWVTKAIIDNLENPSQLEQLYQSDKKTFVHSFEDVYKQFNHHLSAQIWNERLNKKYEVNVLAFKKKDLLFLLIGSLIAGIIAKIPHYFKLIEDEYYAKNISFIIVPLLVLFFSWKKNLNPKKIALSLMIIIASVLYINLLPPIGSNNSLILACMHLPIFLWSVVGYTFIGANLKNNALKINYLKFNGDLLVMSALLVIAGGLFSGITLGLFNLIEVKIEQFYFNYVVVWGLSSIPLIATYLVQTNLSLVSKISPIIARIFTPLVLLTVLAFLTTLLYTGKNIYSDRNFLLTFNALLIGVMAIILFSVTEATKNESNKITLLVLLILSILTVVVNGIALSAILFRLAEFGITPNRLAILGANLLIFVNLILVSLQLYQVVSKKVPVEKVGLVIATFIPYYAIWAFLVTFLFPILFQYK